MMRLQSLFVFALVLAIVPPLFTFAEDDGFVSIFDGKTLDGWDGDPKFWSVSDGAITGQTTADNPTQGNTFIIWKGGEVGDFELKLEYKIIGGNSGIQYRSFVREDGPDRWRIGGYQADFEAGDRYSGICYGEAFRGILADRGEKTVLTNKEGKFQKEVVGSVGDSDEIGKQIKKEDWNEYHITARDFDFVHKINGVTTCELTDNDEKARRASGLLALQLHAGPPMKVQFRNIRIKKLKADSTASNVEPKKNAGTKKVVFVAGKKSHGYGSHEHYAGCVLLAKALQQGISNIEVEVVRDGWPKDESVFDGVDCVVMYADGGGGHPVIPHLAKLDSLAEQGVGVVCLHYAVEIPAGEPGDHFLKWIGGYFEANWSVNPHWNAKFDKFPDHPIANGVQPFESHDEWYYHMRFRPNMEGVTPILTDMPGPETLSRPDGAHSGNPHVRAAVLERKEPQHVAWAATRPDGGRGFGFTGGHNHWNWGEPNFRKLVLNAIVWCAKAEVPADGVGTKPVTLDQLEENQDYQPQPNFNRDAIRKQYKLGAGSQPRNMNRGPAAKPVFSSPIVTTKTPEHSVAIDVDLQDAKELYLVVTDGGDGFSCDWADWAEPRLIGAAGELKLTELKWKSASTDFGQVRINQNVQGEELRIAGKSVAYGIGTHANSIVAFDVPAGYTKFQARGGLDNGGTDQGSCGNSSSVQFHVFTKRPNQVFVKATGGNMPASHEAADALDQLEVHEKLQADLFASEPMMLNPTNIDIDHLGRVWVCEVVNYRSFRNKDIIGDKRPEGDRILILEDTNQDGKADKASTFYQGSDVDSAHGICVLGTPSGKGTRALVSAKDSVFYLIDDDGDLQADRKELLFTGIDGTEHDHGIHAFVFGPDGKLYFNFGNAGRRIKDRDGKPIVDSAGNEVNDSRKPYQEGMVFRCNMDGSEFETLGWNFRNNWEVCVDSFGTMWQSDNDDDGNKGTRINFVMEFGNYGYKDEFTGAGWKEERTGMSDEIPLRHWHLNDPGVVPNLVQTGAGSPTGICVYEGTLLPREFQGQVFHCDAGPNSVRMYPAVNSGAGYKAEMVSILDGSAHNKWFRPSDVCVAPDGSLLVADWYDPGVGGHRMEDIDHGRLFRVTPNGHDGSYRSPAQDFSTVAGAIRALASPNLATRYVAWTTLHAMGTEAEDALVNVVSQSQDPRQRARALWLLGKIDGRGAHYVETATNDKDSDIRILGIRLARQLDVDIIPLASRLAKDPSAQVRREVAIAIRHHKSEKMPGIWAELALQHDGQDRWYLEALGISADKNWDACLGAWMKRAGAEWNSPAGRDIIWRSRAKQTPASLAKIVQDDSTPTETHPRYMRAFDFLSGPEKEQALQSILLGL
ncbi:MAG: PVC-type heme-binding CxxCH protein [Pirellulaceae bacterium]